MITVINDLHIGVQRSGGTTIESASKLREYTIDMFTGLLCMGKDIVINGDAFDTYQIPMLDLYLTYQAAAGWLDLDGANKLTLIPGNHDLSKNSANLSSFELMARLLQSNFPEQVRYLPGGNWVREEQGVYAISHMPNQELFELELEKVPDNVKYLLLHVNFDNKFAGQSDHSLDITREQAKEFTKRGVTLILGHEHQGRALMGDKVVIVGNQFPTSVSDCLSHNSDAQADGCKYCLQIDGDDMELVKTWSPSEPYCGYTEVDWENLATVADTRGFIRVTGKATAEQSAAVINMISKLRQTSKAFVITNAVKVAGSTGEDEFAESVEDIRSVNVIEMLLETLTTDQQAVIRTLLKEAA